MPLLDQGEDDAWTTGLFDFALDAPGCVDNLLCFPCQLGRQHDALNGLFNSLNISHAILAGILFCGAPCFVYELRAGIRSKYGIRGSSANDVAVSCFCLPCTHCMNHRELSNRGMWPGGSCCSSQPPGGTWVGLLLVLGFNEVLSIVVVLWQLRHSALVRKSISILTIRHLNRSLLFHKTFMPLRPSAP